jgi:hypothetical protein
VADGGPPLNEARAYFRGIRNALAAIEKRLEARKDLSGEDALREIRRYRQMVTDNLEGLEHIDAS